MKKKGTLTTLLLVFVFLIGLSLLLYPTLSNYWNSKHQTRAIAAYTQEVALLDEADYSAIWEAALRYNESLLDRSNVFLLNEEQQKEYDTLLNVSGTGIMGHIEIPNIDVSLPIYHGTTDGVLQIAVGHIEWTSLPVGGRGSHCVLSGHRALPSAKLFTNLDRLSEGDVFMLCILDEVLTYEVDKILIVEPSDTKALQIVEGEDYCTLATCTPYGINTHRLLVRGHRIETEQEVSSVRVTADAIQIEPLIVAPVIAVPILTVLLLAVLCFPVKKK